MFDGSLIEYTAYLTVGRGRGGVGDGGVAGGKCNCVRVLAAKHFPHFPGKRWDSSSLKQMAIKLNCYTHTHTHIGGGGGKSRGGAEG